MDNLISEKSRKMDDSKVVNSSRNPRCAHCRNHGVQTTLKGHKAYCPYRNCNCGLCQLVRMRQKVMAKNVALRRRQELDKMKMHEILHSHKNDESGTMMSTLMSGERDGEKSNSEAESESPSSARNPEGNHISALALIILNFYNNDPKVAMDSIKKVASELSTLIQGDTVNSESGHNLQHGEGKHLNSSDLERISTATPNEIFSPSAFTSSPKKVIFPATPSMYLSPFHPLALKTYRSTLAQGQLSTPLTRRSEQDQNGARAESKIDLKSHVNESPFSIKSLTSELNNKSKSKPHQIEPSSHPILPFFGMAGHLRHVPATFAFPQPQQPFACVPFPTFQALPTTMWAKNWCRRDHNTDVLPSHNQY